MTKLESYMVDGRFTATQFYADIEGHPDDQSVQLALEELEYFTPSSKYSELSSSRGTALSHWRRWGPIAPRPKLSSR